MKISSDSSEAVTRQVPREDPRARRAMTENGRYVIYARWMIRAARSDSRTRSAVAAVGRRLTGLRVRGWVVVVAGVTALGMNAVKPTPVGPLSWVLPSIVIVAGVAIMLMAGPLGRVILHRTS